MPVFLTGLTGYSGFFQILNLVNPVIPSKRSLVGFGSKPESIWSQIKKSLSPPPLIIPCENILHQLILKIDFFMVQRCL